MVMTDGLSDSLGLPRDARKQGAVHGSYGINFPKVARFYVVMGTARVVSGSDMNSPANLAEMLGPLANHDANQANIRQPSCRARYSIRNGIADPWKVVAHIFL